MSDKAGSVSVIIPAWNARRYIAEAISSVAIQGPVVGEILVVDDGSEDDTAEVAAAASSRVRVLSGPHAGIAAARNRGVREARGELLAFLDADDLWTPDKLARQLPVLREQPDALVLGQVLEFVSPELTPEARAALRPKPGLLPGMLAGALLCRREVFTAHPAFDEALAVGEIIAWFARARETGTTEVVLPDLVLRRRLHGENFTLQTRDLRAGYLALAKQLLDRKRQQGGGP